MPQISIVIGSYNRNSFLQAVIESVRANGIRVPYELIVVDGGSNDGSLGWLIRQKDIVTIIQHNHGTFRGKPVHRRSWGYFMNLAFKCAQGKYICMLSDDCIVVPGAIMNGYDYFEEQLKAGKKVGALAFYYREWPRDKGYRVQRTLGNKVTVNHGMYLRTAMEEVGYAEEQLYSFYCADTDLCLKMWQKGYLCLDAPDSYVEHCHILKGCVAAKISAWIKTDKGNRDIDVFLKRWTGVHSDNGEWVAGTPLLKAHEDSFNTAEQFKGMVPFTAVLRGNLWSILARLRSLGRR